MSFARRDLVVLGTKSSPLAEVVRGLRQRIRSPWVVHARGGFTDHEFSAARPVQPQVLVALGVRDPLGAARSHGVLVDLRVTCMLSYPESRDAEMVIREVLAVTRSWERGLPLAPVTVHADAGSGSRARNAPPDDPVGIASALHRMAGEVKRLQALVPGRSGDLSLLSHALDAMANDASFARATGVQVNFAGGDSVPNAGGSDVEGVDEAERASRELAMGHLGTLVAAVMHEIRTPLAYLRTNEHVVKRLVDRVARGDLDAARRQRLLQASATAAKTIEGLDRIDGIIHSVYHVAGRVGEPRQDFELGEALEGAMPLLQLVARRRRVALEVFDTGPVWVRGGLIAFSQVVLNLVKNAVEASPEGTPVRLAIGASGTEGWVQIDDGGPGLVQRSDGAASPHGARRPSQNLGIGLAVSRRLAARHGGVIVGEDHEVGPGARFTLRLPLRGSVRAAEVDAAQDAELLDEAALSHEAQ